MLCKAPETAGWELGVALPLELKLLHLDLLKLVMKKKHIIATNEQISCFHSFIEIYDWQFWI